MADFIQYPAYTVPNLSIDKAQLLNCCLERQASWETTFGRSKAQWTLLPEAPDFAPVARFIYTIDGHDWLAELSDATVINRHPAFAGVTESETD